MWAPWNVWPFIYRPRRYYARLRERYGEIVTLHAPHATLVMALSPEVARQVLGGDPADYGAFQKEAFGGLAGSGSLFVLEADRHRQERKLISPPFHAQNVRNYGQAIQEIARQHTDQWRPGQEICARDAMLAVSRDVILRVVYGDDHASSRNEGQRVLKSTLDAAHPLLEYLVLFQRSWFPPWVRFQRAKGEFTRFAAKTLSDRHARDKGTGDLPSTPDVLSLLLSARHHDGTPMSFKEIRDELYTVLLPGHATTGVALAWALYELGRHPEVLRTLREELDSVGPDPDPMLIVKLPYLGAVCSETIRRHTIVTEFARMLLSPCNLYGYEIPAGTGVAVSISAIHQDPTVYPEPDQFRPGRFLERQFGPHEFLPFGGGHRRCLGAALSDFEMRITLATITANWELELLDEERERRHNLGMGPQHGVRLRVEGRRSYGWAKSGVGYPHATVFPQGLSQPVIMEAQIDGPQ